MSKDRLTLLIFKDNLSGRTFRVSPTWITRLGLVVLSCAAVTILTAAYALKSHWVPKASTPASRKEDALEEIRDEFEQLKGEHQELKKRAKELLRENKTLTQAAVMVEKELTEPVPAEPSPAGPALSMPNQGSATSRDASSLLFSILPPSVAKAPSSPISMSIPQLQWFGSRLRVKFNLQFNNPNAGRQQGNIVILARGPSRLLAYPDGVLNRPESTALIAPDRGEPFAVSRFREVLAEFGPIQAKNLLHTVEVLVFDQAGSVLLFERIAVPQDGGA